MKKNNGNADLILVLPLLIILLWGFSLCYAFIYEKNEVNQHLWQAGISNWNKKDLKSYKRNLSKKKLSHIHIKSNASSFISMNLLYKLPLSFKLFQQFNKPHFIKVASHKKTYSYLDQLNKYLTKKNLKKINIETTALFPSARRKNKKQLYLLKHGLWTEGMCKAGFDETFLPLLGVNLLQKVALGIKLPFKIPQTPSLPQLRCPL